MKQLEGLVGGKYTFSHHHDLPAPVEKAVTAHAVGKALSLVVGEIVDARFDPGDACRQDHGTGLQFRLFGLDPETLRLGMYGQNAVAADVHVEPPGLLHPALDEFLAGDRFGESEIVVDGVVAGDVDAGDRKRVGAGVGEGDGLRGAGFPDLDPREDQR